MRDASDDGCFRLIRVLDVLDWFQSKTLRLVTALAIPRTQQYTAGGEETLAEENFAIRRRGGCWPNPQSNLLKESPLSWIKPQKRCAERQWTGAEGSRGGEIVLRDRPAYDGVRTFDGW